MNTVVATELTAALTKWYADHSTIRCLWAIEDAPDLVVYVALEPSSDGDDALPVWLANQQNWANDLRRATNREVQLQLVVSGTLEDLDIRADATTIAQLSWRQSWEH